MFTPLLQQPELWNGQPLEIHIQTRAWAMRKFHQAKGEELKRLLSMSNEARYWEAQKEVLERSNENLKTLLMESFTTDDRDEYNPDQFVQDWEDSCDKYENDWQSSYGGQDEPYSRDY